MHFILENWDNIFKFKILFSQNTRKFFPVTREVVTYKAAEEEGSKCRHVGAGFQSMPCFVNWIFYLRDIRCFGTGPLTKNFRKNRLNTNNSAFITVDVVFIGWRLRGLWGVI